jgi:hypothetical protein
MRFCQLRLNEVMARCPGSSASGPWPKQGPHHDCADLPADPAEDVGDRLAAQPRIGPLDQPRLTPPEPGNTTNSFCAFVSPCARAATSTSAA